MSEARRWRLKDLTGQRFGKLVVANYVVAHKASRWRCVCDCGGERLVLGARLRRGDTASCGCTPPGSQGTHRRSHTLVYGVWAGMRYRCTNPRSREYPNYGGRGIAVCERWGRFENFLADMGEPTLGKSIDRIDVNGDYSPENCRWADAKTQMENRRSTYWMTHEGTTATMAEWARRKGMSKATLSQRLQRGWSVAATLDTPPDKRRARRTPASSRARL